MSGRIRTIKPEWLDDELLAAASDEARVLSVALVLMADDYGRGRASLATIAAGAWRYQLERDDGAHAPEILARASRAFRELLGVRFVVVYEVAGQKYFAIRNWKKHQRVDKPGRPRVPEPPNPAPPETPVIAPAARDSRDSREESASDSRGPRETLVTDLRPVPPTTTGRGEDRAQTRDAPPVRSLSRDGEIIRQAAERAFKAAGAVAPRAVRDIDGKHWLALVDPLRDVATRHGEDLSTVAERLLAGFIASPRAASKGYPIAWLAENPGEYLGARVEPAVNIPVLLGGIPSTSIAGPAGIDGPGTVADDFGFNEPIGGTP